jgi:hypothetical protein
MEGGQDFNPFNMDRNVLASFNTSNGDGTVNQVVLLGLDDERLAELNFPQELGPFRANTMRVNLPSFENLHSCLPQPD